ncbi:hypothetical protein ACVGVM_19495 [Pseudonocardia bannensis]|uniref:Uncharacterized protein n=1 Tax=Pseudonocardia bannensis TaxID=630973 RepID=A0A848DH21_9PSEU|nr:hypothetical protein [Pseudonocardia bannensis]NMH91978.1 hypothetical protein [Pseudonocardia bannensis]
MSADHDYSGDYGYDLVTEVRTALQLPSARGALLPHRAGGATGRQLYLDGDLGYDQAHEV